MRVLHPSLAKIAPTIALYVNQPILERNSKKVLALVFVFKLYKSFIMSQAIEFFIDEFGRGI